MKTREIWRREIWRQGKYEDKGSWKNHSKTWIY